MTDEAGGGEVSVPLSALEHVAYCDRQAALIHVESVWAETVETIRGDLSHQTVDLPGIRRGRGVVAVRSLPVWSDVHGLHGVCDLVEFIGDTACPVEYKVGGHVPGGPSEVQVGGQALCLREAGYAVPVGYVYSAAERRRHEVAIDDALVERTLAAVRAFRAVVAAQSLPTARNDSRCRRCSLRDDCLPELTYKRSTTSEVDLYKPRPLGRWS